MYPIVFLESTIRLHWVSMFLSCGERSSVTSSTNASLLVNVARHDADLALFRLDNSRTVWADKAGLCLLTKTLLDHRHVVLRNAFSNANY